MTISMTTTHPSFPNITWLAHYGDKGAPEDQREYLVALQTAIAPLLAAHKPRISDIDLPDILNKAIEIFGDEFNNEAYEVFTPSERDAVREGLDFPHNQAARFKVLFHAAHMFVHEYNRDVTEYQEEQPWSMQWAQSMNGPQADLLMISCLVEAALAL